MFSIKLYKMLVLLMIDIKNIDNRRGLLELNDNSIDLVITSPPYKDADGYSHNLIYNTFSKIYTVMKKNSLLFLNFGHLANFKTRPFHVVRILTDLDYKLNDTIIWVKNHYSPIQGSVRVNNLFEYVFMFYKGKMPKLDRLSIGVPYVCKGNVGRFAEQDLKCGGNVWYINYETIVNKEQKLHNDRFPVELPERCIKLSGIKKGSLVLDPFSGSGTTGVACKNLGMNYIGFEINKKHYKTSLERLGI